MSFSVKDHTLKIQSCHGLQLNPLPTSRSLVMCHRGTRGQTGKFSVCVQVHACSKFSSAHSVCKCLSPESDSISKPWLSVTTPYETYMLSNQSINVSCLTRAASPYFTQKQQIMSEVSFTTSV